MKSSFILILTLLFFAKIQDTIAQSYAINPFIQFIQNNGIWEVLTEIKKYFGTDVAIEVCVDFLESPHCDEVVKVYIIDNKANVRPDYLDRTELMAFLKKNGYLIILKTANPQRFPIIEKKYQLIEKEI